MKRFFVILILALNLGLLGFSLAQGSRSDLFDQKKVEYELQIMQGILGTTLDFAIQEIQAASTNKGGSERHLPRALDLENISGFYLYGQGATFVIPTSGLALPWHRSGRIALGLGVPEVEVVDYAEAMEAAQEAMQEAQEELVDVQEEAREQLAQAGEGISRVTVSSAALAVPIPPPAPPAPPAASAQPAPQAKPDEEAIRKRLVEAQEKVKQRREVLEQRQQKFRESLAQLKDHLVEALANHGDSLTSVKPNEFINLILSTDIGGGGVPGGRSGSRSDIISVQRSAVTDYKAGRLTLEAFKQKVLQYSN